MVQGELEVQHREAVAAVAEVRRAVGAVEGYPIPTQLFRGISVFRGFRVSELVF